MKDVLSKEYDIEYDIEYPQSVPSIHTNLIILLMFVLETRF